MSYASVPVKASTDCVTCHAKMSCPVDIPDFDKLALVDQNQRYHGEGDVLTHTKMVLDELCSLSAWSALDEEKQFMLYLAAALHDIGKSQTTRVENGIIRSPNHARVGAMMARHYLWKGIPEPVPFHVREQIVHLILHHTFPYKFLGNKNNDELLIKMSQTVDLSLLKLLSVADILGRISDDKEHLLEVLELFEVAARDCECFDHPYQFPSAYSRFVFFHKEIRSVNKESRQRGSEDEMIFQSWRDPQANFRGQSFAKA